MRNMEKLKDWIASIPIKSQAEFMTLPGFLVFVRGNKASALGQMNDAPFLGLLHGQLQI